jgi:phosphate-selective porin OprO/OprP
MMFLNRWVRYEICGDCADYSQTMRIVHTLAILTASLAAGASAESPLLVERLPPVAPEVSLAAHVAELQQPSETPQKAEKTKPEADPATPTAKFTMQLQADSIHFNQDAANRATLGDIEDAAVFRRARVGWTGDYQLTEYRIEFDFALSGRPSFLDVWVAWKDLPYLGQLKVGHYYEPFCLDRYTSNRYMTFMERSLLDQAFAPARNLGIMSSNHNDERDITWAWGLFRTDSDVFGDDLGDNADKSLTGRVTWLPWYDEPSGGRYFLHLGAGSSFRDADDNTARFSAAPEIRSNNTDPPTPFFVDTLDIPARNYQLYGLEAALVRGPLSVQAELVSVPVDRIGGSDVAFYGAYVFASYFLTGEHRPYHREQGVFDRVMPFEEFFLVRTRRGVCAGWGAWEVAARLSYLDLDDADIRGGLLNELTLGLNWYMNPYTRITANYAHAFLDREPVGQSNCGIWGLRAGFEF